MAKVLLDFDSTLTLLDEHLLATCNLVRGTKYVPEDVTHWDWLSNECPHAEWLWSEACYGSREWQLSVPPQPGAIDVVREMVRAGLDPIIVSDRGGHSASWLMDWLEMHRLAVSRVVFSNRETRPKWQVAQKYGLEFAIEDAPHHAIDLAAAGIPVYLIDKPYNRAVIDHELINRVRGGWYEIAELLGISMVERWAA